MLPAEQLKPLLKEIEDREKLYDTARRETDPTSRSEASTKPQDGCGRIEFKEKLVELKKEALAPDEIFLHELELLGSTWRAQEHPPDAMSPASQPGALSDGHVCIFSCQLFFQERKKEKFLDVHLLMPALFS